MEKIDGLAEPHFVGEEEARAGAAHGFGDDGELVGDEVDPGAGEAAGRGSPDPGVPFQRLQPDVEVARVVGEPGEQALVRADEAQRVEQIGFGDPPPVAVVGQDSLVVAGNFLDDNRLPGAVRDGVARAEADPDERGGSRGRGWVRRWKSIVVRAKGAACGGPSNAGWPGGRG